MKQTLNTAQKPLCTIPSVGDFNLKAMCQRCHLRYDAKHHAETRRKKRIDKRQTVINF